MFSSSRIDKYSYNGIGQNNKMHELFPHAITSLNLTNIMLSGRSLPEKIYHIISIIFNSPQK